MFLTVSVDDILKRVYAESALRSVTGRNNQRGHMLTRDNESALRRVIIDNFHWLVGELAPVMVDFGPEPAPDQTDILYMELTGDEKPGMARLLAKGLASRVLAGLFGTEEAAFGDHATALLLESARPQYGCGRVSPHGC